jgi:hypothetical protein
MARHGKPVKLKDWPTKGYSHYPHLFDKSSGNRHYIYVPAQGVYFKTNREIINFKPKKR